jgi:hypothetical protein
VLNLAIIATILVVVLVIGCIEAFAAKPLDLIINAKFEQAEIESGKKPVITGTVIDQKGNPVFGAEVKIRFVDNSVNTTTDEDGNFRYEFSEQEGQGMFVANVFATIYELKGFGNASLKIGDGVSTFDDLYYTKNFEKDLKNDPYKALKQKQYQKFIEDQNKRKLKQNEILAKKMAHQEKITIAGKRLDDAIIAEKPGAGIYSYEDQKQYLSKADPRVKGMLEMQMNYTRQIYAEAKHEMQKVLERGGSLQDAKKAYFDKIVSTKDQVSGVGSQNNTESHSIIKKHQDGKINSKKVKGLTYNKYFK